MAEWEQHPSAAALGLVTGLICMVAVGVRFQSSNGAMVAFFVGATLPLLLIMGRPTKIAERPAERDPLEPLRGRRRDGDDDD